jgi:hypothetical protein
MPDRIGAEKTVLISNELGNSMIGVCARLNGGNDRENAGNNRTPLFYAYREHERTPSPANPTINDKASVYSPPNGPCAARYDDPLRFSLVPSALRSGLTSESDEAHGCQ